MIVRIILHFLGKKNVVTVAMEKPFHHHTKKKILMIKRLTGKSSESSFGEFEEKFCEQVL